MKIKNCDEIKCCENCKRIKCSFKNCDLWYNWFSHSWKYVVKLFEYQRNNKNNDDI